MHPSAALAYQSDSYPASWRGKVPKRVVMAKTVAPDFPFLIKGDIKTCVIGSEYEVYVNSHGAVSAWVSDTERLGLKPYEFEVIEWHGEEP